MQERDALLEKDKQLKAEWHELSLRAEEDYTTEDIWRVEELNKEIPAIASRLQEIGRKLEMYDVVCDCIEELLYRKNIVK